MLTAINEKGERFIIQKSHSAVFLKQMRKEKLFFCEVCGSPVTLKIGEQVTWHFAHKPNAHCGIDHEPESFTHIEGKRSLYDWLKRQGYMPVMERYFPEIKQRPDIYVHSFQKDWAIEYQCSPILPERFFKRNQGYARLHIQPVWILGGNRLKRYGSHIYKWMQTDELIALQTGRGKKPYVIFYDGQKNAFTVLYHFWPLSLSAVMADRVTIPANKTTVNKLVSYSFPGASSEGKQEEWLKQKAKWRASGRPFKSKLERYVNTICQKRRLYFHCFPPYIGLPIQDDLTIASPAYLWQAWLVIQFIYPHPIGTSIRLRSIIEAFRRMADSKIILLRENGKHQQGEIRKSLIRYLLALEQFSIIQKGNQDNYIIKRRVDWLPKTLSELQKQDRVALWRWTELEV